MKISASVCKKIPIHGTQFSSQQYGAGLEVEVPDGLQGEELQEKLRRLYGILARSIDGQIAATAAAKADGNGNGDGSGKAAAAVPARPAVGQGGSGGAIRFIPATAAQQRAVYAICKELGIEVAAVLAERGVAGMERLGLKTASQIIDALKAKRGR
jgi:hypothetical protein